MMNSELAAQILALSSANRRAVVLTENPDFIIFASGYNAALVDVMVGIGEVETARKLEIQIAKLFSAQQA